MKSTRSAHAGIFVLAALCLAMPVQAQRKTWAQLGIGSTIDPSLAASADGYIFLLGGEESGKLRASYIYDSALGRWKLSMSSGIYDKTSECDEKCVLLGGTFDSHSEKYTKSLGTDKQIISIKDNSVLIENFLKGKNKGTARIALDKPMLDLDLLPLMLPALIKSGAQTKDFNSDILLKSRGWRINADISYLPPGSAEPAAEARKTPAAFQALLKAYPAYHCFKIHPTGIIGIVSGSFYLIFADDAQKRFIGYWGGGGRDMEGLILELK